MMSIQLPLSMKNLLSMLFRSMVSLLTSNWILQSSLKATLSMRVLSLSHTPLSRSLVSQLPVLCLPSFSRVFPSFLQRPMISIVRLWVHPPFATQLDLDLDENALPVSASVADTLEDDDLVDHSLSVSTVAADALEGVFPVHSVPPEVTSTQFDSVNASPCQDQSPCPPVPEPGPHTFPVGNPNPLPSPQWCLKITAGQDTRRVPLLTTGTPSYHDILLGVSALFRLPPTSVCSSLLLCYCDGDSCTLTSVSLPDALPLFLHDHVILLSAAAIHRNVCTPPVSPRAPPSAQDISPHPFAHNGTLSRWSF